MSRAKNLVLQEYDKIVDLVKKSQTALYNYDLELTHKRLVLEVLLDIRDHLAGVKPSVSQTQEKEDAFGSQLLEESPSAERPVQSKVEGEKYDPNGPPTSKQWWRLDEIKKQVSENRWRQHLDEVSVSVENELTLVTASKIIDQVAKSNEKS